MTRGESDTRGHSSSTHLVLAGKGSQRSSPRTNWEETKAGVAEEKRKPRGGGGGWGGGLQRQGSVCLTLLRSCERYTKEMGLLPDEVTLLIRNTRIAFSQG